MKVEITVTPTAPVAMGIPSVGAPPPWGGHSAPRRAKPATPEEQGLVAVRSPVMGVFYRAASPETPPYVEVGARVEEGDIVGLVEAMKVFNEIASEVTGEVVEVVAKNGDLVELDQPLVWLRP